MTNKDIIEYWKNSEHRLNLTAEERAKLPANPAGLVELTDEALDDLISGGGLNEADAASCGWDSCNSAQLNAQ
jgi:mersacidin/lichenicidin family type 2 lantibiotic